GTASGTIALTGRVVPDERQRSVLTAHIGGRIENLMVNLTGSRVAAGQVLAEIYSPELYNAQQELRQAYAMREQQPALYAAARTRMSLWKFEEEEVDAMARSEDIRAIVPIRAERGGFVTRLNVQ